jgi:hypothetical protein
MNFIKQYEDEIPKLKNLRKFIWSIRGVCWSRLILHHSHTCFSSLAKSNGSLISCIRFLGSVFGMVPPVPAQQEDSAEDMPQKGVRIAPKEGVPEVGGAAPAKHRINTNLSGGTRTRVKM